MRAIPAAMMLAALAAPAAAENEMGDGYTTESLTCESFVNMEEDARPRALRAVLEPVTADEVREDGTDTAEEVIDRETRETLMAECDRRPDDRVADVLGEIRD